MEQRLWATAPFEFNSLPQTDVRQKWLDYKRQFQYVAASADQAMRVRLRGIFLAVAGSEVQKVYESLVGGNEEADVSLEGVFRRLDGYFAPRRHDTHERFVFWSMQPQEGETLEKFALRAQVQLNKCDFGATAIQSREVAMIDKLVMLAPERVQKEILGRAEVDLAQVNRMIQSHVSIEQQAQSLRPAGAAAGSALNLSVASTSRIQRVSSYHGGHQRSKENFVVNGPVCYRCGYSQHTGDQKCPAKNQKCRSCNKVGHYARVCRSSNPNERLDSRKRHLEPQNSVESSTRAKVNNITTNPTGSDEEDSLSVCAIEEKNDDECIWCNVGGAMVMMLIDSGSKCNILSEASLKFLQQSDAKIGKLQPSDKHFKAYGQENPLEVIGKFEAEIEVGASNGKNKTVGKFYVVKNGDQTLLGRDTARQLNVLRVGLPTGTTNDEQVNSISPKTFPKIRGKLTVSIEFSYKFSSRIQALILKLISTKKYLGSNRSLGESLSPSKSRLKRNLTLSWNKES